MRKVLIALLLSLLTAAAVAESSPAALLLRKPTASRSQIAFTYGGEIWAVDRNGGEARQLTSGGGDYSDPIFSPDGSSIAFSGRVDVNADVYVIPAEGGIA